ncbi:hypothetical protein WA026_015140 [Henosepilachna vigintioctopunctata]|uniref:Zinc finger PHD-type domain-containing protein n=1 Tax=Henosepilachna vigintioctopunctata TaxID=420089 RepID=A0AAW1TVZ6_9CUCU
MPNENNFSPEIIRPHQKAAARTTKITRKTRKSAILTDTPEKNALALAQSNKKENKSKKGKSGKGGKSTGKKTEQENTHKRRKTSNEKKSLAVKRKVLHDTDEESEVEDGYFCLICCDPFDPKQSGEEWVECRACKNWSHVKCVRGNITHYICLNCESDDSDYSN